MAETDEIIEAQIEKFDALREVFLDENVRLFLLKSVTDSVRFISIIEMTGGWFVKFNGYREQMQFEFATLDAGFADKFAQVSHIGYGTPDFDNEIDVFAIEERDKIPPNGKSPTWKCFGGRIENQRYIVPVMPEPEPPVVIPPTP